MSAPPNPQAAPNFVPVVQPVRPHAGLEIVDDLIRDWDQLVRVPAQIRYANGTSAEDGGFGARLLSEFDTLRELSPIGPALWILFILAIAWVLAWGGPAIVRTIWRLGIDPRRRLGLLASGFRIAGLVVGVAGVLRPLMHHAPTLGIATIVLLTALAGVIAPLQLRNLASGVSLATRSRLREGDLVTIGRLEGTVRDIGLLRISLRTVDGGITHVPAGDFEREAVTVGSRRAAVPIEAHALVSRGFDEQATERLRRALWLSPYRRASTDPHVLVDVETGRIDVRIDTWAATSTVEVERHLKALLIQMTDGFLEPQVSALEPHALASSPAQEPSP